MSPGCSPEAYRDCGIKQKLQDTIDSQADQIAQQQITIQMHYSGLLTAQAAIKRYERQIASMKAIPPDIYQVKCKCGNIIEINNGVLYSRIDEKDKQIASLKEIATKERAAGNAAKHCAALVVHPKAIAGLMLTIDDHVSKFIPEARKQLEAEYPEAMK